jgi:hypothetical protein
MRALRQAKQVRLCMYVCMYAYMCDGVSKCKIFETSVHTRLVESSKVSSGWARGRETIDPSFPRAISPVGIEFNFKYQNLLETCASFLEMPVNANDFGHLVSWFSSIAQLWGTLFYIHTQDSQALADVSHRLVCLHVYIFYHAHHIYMFIIVRLTYM